MILGEGADVLLGGSQKLYVVASSQADSRNHKDSRYRVLKIDRTHTNEEDGGLNITEDSAVYSKAEIDELLETLSAGNAGGVKKVVESFYGIAGECSFPLYLQCTTR